MPAVAVVEAGHELGEHDLTRIVRLVYEKSGITLHEGKRALIHARLQKRVREGRFRSFSDYLKHVESDATGNELTMLLDAIATNHTSFLREPQHFTFLSTVVVPQLLAAGTGRIEGWSAACSTGEEPYTLAMTLGESLGCLSPGRVRLLASDLSTKALSVAKQAVYKAERVQDVPTAQLKRYFEKGLGQQAGLVRVAPPARAVVEFAQMNLLEIPTLDRTFDFIFCRNVMIYFDLAVRQRVVQGLARRLRPGGYLFISHSESLSGVRHDLRWVAPAVYRSEAR